MELPKGSREVKEVTSFFENILVASDNPMHYNKLFMHIENAFTDTFFHAYSSSDQFKFFKNDPKNFVIDSDGFVFSKKRILEICMAQLKSCASAHYRNLFAVLEKCYCFSQRWLDKDRFQFFKNCPESFIIDGNGYVRLSFGNVATFVTSEQIEKLIDHEQVAKVIRFFKLNLEHFGVMYFTWLIDRLSLSSLNVRNFCNRIVLHKWWSFFKKRPDDFTISDDGFVDLPLSFKSKLHNSDSDPEKKELKITGFFISQLVLKGQVLFSLLLKCLQDSILHEKNFFAGYSLSEFISYFTKHRELFIMIQRNVLLLCCVSNFSVKKEMTYNSQKMYVEQEEAVGFFLIHLKINIYIHFEKLAKLFEDSTIDSTFKQAFIMFTVREKYSFFKSRSKIFTIGDDGYISIPTMLTISYYEKRAIWFFIKCLQNNVGNELLNFWILVNSLETSKSSVKFHFKDFSPVDKFNFFRRHSYIFNINSGGFVSLNTTQNPISEYVCIQEIESFFSLETQIIEMLVEELQIHDVVHVNKLCNNVISQSQCAKEFFSKLVPSERFNFFEYWSMYFSITKDGHVSRYEPNENDNTSPSQTGSSVMSACSNVCSYQDNGVITEVINPKESDMAASLKSSDSSHLDKNGMTHKNQKLYEFEFTDMNSENTTNVEPVEIVNKNYETGKQQALVKYFMSRLKKMKTVHFQKLFSSAVSKGFNSSLVDLTVKEMFKFFRDQPEQFIIANDGFVSLQRKTKPSEKEDILPQDDQPEQFIIANDGFVSLQRKTKPSEKEDILPQDDQIDTTHASVAIAFFEIILYDIDNVHYEELFKELEESNLHCSEHFAAFTQLEKLKFFENCSRIFIVNPEGFVSLTNANSCPNSYALNCPKGTTHKEKINTSILNEETCATDMKLNRTTHHLGKFHVDIIRCVFNVLKSHGPLFYLEIVKILCMQQNSFITFFKLFAFRLDILEFFELHSMYFKIESEMVSLKYPVIDAQTILLNDGDDTLVVIQLVILKVIQYCENILKIELSLSVTELRKHLTWALGYVIYFIDTNCSEDEQLISFFKDHSNTFNVDKDNYISLKLNESSPEKVSGSMSVSHSMSEKSLTHLEVTLNSNETDNTENFHNFNSHKNQHCQKKQVIQLNDSNKDGSILDSTKSLSNSNLAADDVQTKENTDKSIKSSDNSSVTSINDCTLIDSTLNEGTVEVDQVFSREHEITGTFRKQLTSLKNTCYQKDDSTEVLHHLETKEVRHCDQYSLKISQECSSLCSNSSSVNNREKNTPKNVNFDHFVKQLNESDKFCIALEVVDSFEKLSVHNDHDIVNKIEDMPVGTAVFSENCTLESKTPNVPDDQFSISVLNDAFQKLSLNSCHEGEKHESDVINHKPIKVELKRPPIEEHMVDTSVHNVKISDCNNYQKLVILSSSPENSCSKNISCLLPTINNVDNKQNASHSENLSLCNTGTASNSETSLHQTSSYAVRCTELDDLAFLQQEENVERLRQLVLWLVENQSFGKNVLESINSSLKQQRVKLLKEELQRISAFYDPELEKRSVDFFRAIIKRNFKILHVKYLRFCASQCHNDDIKTYLANYMEHDFSSFFYNHLDHFQIDASGYVYLQPATNFSWEKGDPGMEHEVANFFAVLLYRYAKDPVPCSSLKEYLYLASEEVRGYVQCNYAKNLKAFFCRHPQMFIVDDSGKVSLIETSCEPCNSSSPSSVKDEK